MIAAARGNVANADREVATGTAVVSMLAAMLFGLINSMATYLQNIGLKPELIQSLPYAVTILGFVVVTIVRDKRESERKRKLFSNISAKGYNNELTDKEMKSGM